MVIFHFKREAKIIIHLVMKTTFININNCSYIGDLSFIHGYLFIYFLNNICIFIFSFLNDY